MRIAKTFYKYIFVFIGLAYFSSCEEDDNKYPLLGGEPQTINEILQSTAELSAFSGGIDALYLNETLDVADTYTMLAPTDQAFSSMDLTTFSDEEVSQIFLNHLISTSTADYVANMTTGYLPTLALGPDGTNLSAFINTEGGLQINGVAAGVQNLLDLGGTNGIVHGIDGVLVPPTVVDHALANPEYSTLAAAMERAVIVDTLSTTGPFTVFAPNNSAFEFFMMQVNDAFGWETLDDIPVDVLKEVLLYHVVSGANNLSGDVDGTDQNTMQGESFSVSGTLIDDASYTNANIDLTDIQGVNGIVHGINKVLLPEDVFQSVLSETLNMVERSSDRGFTTFLQAVEKVEMTNALASEVLTAFAPNNDAFVALFAGINNFASLDDFVTPEDLDILKSLLEYHLYSGTLMEGDLTDDGTINTIYGDAITADLGGDDVKLKPSFTDAIPSTIVNSNIGASNGVIHELNRVLVPDALVSALGIDTGAGGLCPVSDTNLVFFDWDANGPWWGNVQAENDASLSIDGSSYGRANFQTGGTGWQDLFWRNDAGTFNGATIVGANLNEYSLKFDINVIEPLTAGAFRIRFNDADGVDAFYDWAPWSDTGEPFTTDGWETIEIPLALIGQPDFSLVDAEFGMAFEGADVLLNFAMDNVRFDTPGCGPDPVTDTDLVFFDWEDYGPWWGNVVVENDAAISLDGAAYGRANFQTGGTGWQDLFWRNDAGTFNGATTVGSNVSAYVLKFDINVFEPIAEGAFRIRFNDADGVDAFYDWAPWNDSGEPFSTDGWTTVTIPCSLLGVPDFSLVDAEFGMAFEGADILLNFAMDNVRFEEL